MTGMDVSEIIVVTLNHVERMLIEEAMKHFMDNVITEGEDVQTIANLNRVVKILLEKIK